MTTRLVDLSHPVSSGMETYPGLPAPTVSDHLTREDSRDRYADGATFHIGRVDMVANTGTYIDAPFHRFAEGKDLAELPLSSLAELPGLKVDWPVEQGQEVPASAFVGRPLRGAAVLVATGWSRHWGSPDYFKESPFLGEAAARLLADEGAVLVGIDSLNIDDAEGTARPVHTLLLDREIPIVEHLTELHQLPESGFRFSAVPVAFKGMGSFPVRAYARIP